jgi:hypothetical protein
LVATFFIVEDSFYLLLAKFFPIEKKTIEKHATTNIALQFYPTGAVTSKYGLG